MEFSNLRVYQPDGTFKTGGLSISGDRIASAEVSADAVDMGGLYAVPGLVDLHFHGCMGRDFCDGTHEAISTLAKYQAQIGVAAICPATMTYPEDKLTQIAEAAATYQVESNDAALVGINMEGPFISEAKKGAQNGAYLHAPDAAMFRRVQENPAACSSCAIWRPSCRVRWRPLTSWRARCVSRLRTRQRITTPPAKPSSTVPGR